MLAPLAKLFIRLIMNLALETLLPIRAIPTQPTALIKETIETKPIEHTYEKKSYVSTSG